MPAPFSLGKNPQQYELVNLSLGFCVVVGVLTLARIYTRLCIIQRFATEDVFVVASSVVVIAAMTAVLYATRYGLGEHESYLLEYQPTDIIPLVKIIYGFTILYYLGITLAKLSISFTMLRVFPQRWFRIFLYSVMSLTMINFVCSLGVYFGVHWDYALHPAKLLTGVRFNYFFSAVNALTDICLVLVPLPMFWNLQLALRDRVVVCSLFALGLVGAIASIIRIASIHDIRATDTTYAIAHIVKWSLVEADLAALCATLPALRPFFRMILPKNWVKTLHDNNQGTERKSRLGLSVTGQGTQCGDQDSTQEAVLLKALEPTNDDVSGKNDGVLVQHGYTVRCSVMKNENDDADSHTDSWPLAKELGS